MSAARNENVVRVGEVELNLRPTFANLIAAEQELGPLFCLVEKAGDGRLSLAEVVALFDHTSRDRPEGITRAQIGDAVTQMGLSRITPALRRLLGQILQGAA